MLVVLSDTHETDGTGLVGAAAEALTDADLVLHAGDFTTEAVLDGFHDAVAERRSAASQTQSDDVAERRSAGSQTQSDDAADFRAVHGNSDSEAVTDRLPAATTLEYAGVRIALTHRRRGGATGLAMFGRERGADLVISGHSHRPRVEQAGSVTLLNPGSHAEPRGARQSFAVLEPREPGLAGRLVTVDGETFERFEIEGN